MRPLIRSSKPSPATDTADLAIKLWDYSTAQLQRTFLGLNGRPVMLAFSPNGQRLAVEGQEKSFRIFDVSDPVVQIAVASQAPAPARKTTAPAGLAQLPPAPPPTTAGKDRGKMFDFIDKEKQGKITREIYMSRQTDPAAASKRFDQFDADKDGFVTREEFIKQGKKAE